MEEIKDPIQFIREHDTFAKLLNIEIIEAADGCSHVSMPLGKDSCNAVGYVHGAVFFSLADVAFAAACNSEGELSVGIECSIQYMAPVKPEGRLHARSKKIRETRKLGFYRTEITNDDGEIAAVMQSVSFKKGGAEK